VRARSRNLAALFFSQTYQKATQLAGEGFVDSAKAEYAALMQLFPDTDFVNAYGLTETSSTISLLGPEEHRAAAASGDPEIRRRLISVGRPLPSVEVEIHDEEGKPLGPGERGEICVRGEQVSGEYLGRGSRLDRDGWFPTGDVATIDADGFMQITDRSKDVIKSGGEWISSVDLENALMGHEAVREAAGS